MIHMLFGICLVHNVVNLNTAAEWRTWTAFQWTQTLFLTRHTLALARTFKNTFSIPKQHCVATRSREKSLVLGSLFSLGPQTLRRKGYWPELLQQLPWASVAELGRDFAGHQLIPQGDNHQSVCSPLDWESSEREPASFFNSANTQKHLLHYIISSESPSPQWG